MVGGLFHYNYPLGTGLMSGAVFVVALPAAAKEALGGKAKENLATKSAVKKLDPKKKAVAKKAAAKSTGKKSSQAGQESGQEEVTVFRAVQ